MNIVVEWSVYSQWHGKIGAVFVSRSALWRDPKEGHRGGEIITPAICTTKSTHYDRSLHVSPNIPRNWYHDPVSHQRGGWACHKTFRETVTHCVTRAMIKRCLLSGHDVYKAALRGVDLFVDNSARSTYIHNGYECLNARPCKRCLRTRALLHSLERLRAERITPSGSKCDDGGPLAGRTSSLWYTACVWRHHLGVITHHSRERNDDYKAGLEHKKV